MTAPPHASLYVRGKWQKKAKAKAKYQQFVCKTPGSKNKSGPIAVVVLGNGCAKITTKNT